MDIQTWLVEEIRGIRADCKLIARLDERTEALVERMEAVEAGLDKLEKRIEEYDTPPKAYVPMLAHAPVPEKPSAAKSAVVNVSTAGLGGALMWVLQKLFGS